MRICVLADDQQKAEFLEKGIPPDIEIMWADTLKVMYSVSDIDVYFDLQFNHDRERLERLKKINGNLIFINDVNHTLMESDTSFVRINAWPTMLNRSVTEIAKYDPSLEDMVSTVFENLLWTRQVVPDIPGMITPRILSMIINEAYYTLEQEVSTREEIDIAMKLGTNYPMGPFEWSRKIGLKNIHSLLKNLRHIDQRYQPCALLSKEADALF